jgi:deoxyribodipyrimidine photolyase-related protein
LNKIGIVFPHQLFEDNALLASCETIYLIEEWLFFRQYNFHRQKLQHHRASMKFYESYLLSKGQKVHYIDSTDDRNDIRKLIAHFKSEGISEFHYVDTTDNWLEARIASASKKAGITTFKENSPMFLNSTEGNASFFETKKRMFQTDYYIHQRKTKNILLESAGKPAGGKWSFDEDNRAKYPKGKTPPTTDFSKASAFHEEARAYVQKYFGDNYGELSSSFNYPETFESSKAWFHEFLKTRFQEFGIYEDAIVTKQLVLNHSVLTPMLNVGLITPQYIVDATLEFAEAHNIPLNSTEGFIRQIIGWREFIRAVYELKGTQERTTNYWKFTRKIPQSFWDGTTGIEPIDATIKKVLKTGYCHHIERLMVLGNFMLLCEFDPEDVYRWFMEMFIDSYDWVMVPNVYGMSQFADGGVMSTKPYISGSNYLMKMSDYPKGDWQKIWDGLFWNFMDKQRTFFSQNPRLGMLIRSFDKMDPAKKEAHLLIAHDYLKSLDEKAH